MSKRQIKLADLAKELNISTATVSRALKGYPDISEETKKRVIALAKKLNYRPNSLAAGLRKQETRMVGVIIPEIVNHFFSAVIKGIMEVAYQANYRVILCQSDESFEKEVSDAEALMDMRVDGLLASLAHGTNTYKHFSDFEDAGVPVILFDKVTDELNVSKVIVDDYQGAYQAVSHMISQGCKRLAHFRGPMVASTARDRYRGFQDALRDNGIEVHPDLVLDCMDVTHEEGYHFAQYLMARNEAPDALFTINDAVAIGAMVAIKEMGYKIPEDIAICGFSDWKMSSIISPPLTSVSQPAYEMGKQAMGLLLKQMEARKKDVSLQPQTITLNTSLKVRQSTSLSIVA